MYSKFWPKGGLPGILHHYTETLVAFEFTSNTVSKPHSLLFVGGLGDGLGTTSYLSDLVKALEPTPWSIFTLNLSSSYTAWGLGHLDRDVNEIAQCIKYIREYKNDKFRDVKQKIALMGHSTGSQDVLHYLHRPNTLTSKPKFDPDLQHFERLAVDGAIMQAAVSDRQVIQLIIQMGWRGRTTAELQAIWDQLVAMAKSAMESGQSSDTLLPLWMTTAIGYPANTPVSARRFLSLVSPTSPQKPEEDDLFSSDLSDETLAQTFGKVAKGGLLKGKLMVLSSGSDQSVPDWVDKEKLLSRWQKATNEVAGDNMWDEVHSGVVPGASHALSNDDQVEPRKDLVRRVTGYLQDVEKA